MASVTEKPALRPGQRLVDEQIRRTRRSLKLVDLSAGLITLAIGVLGFLLSVAVLEHWVVRGGLSETARTLLFVGLVGGIAWYVWQAFWPLVRQSINPIYAAQAIEQSSPMLKNSLLNLLLLRRRPQQVPRQVYQAIEQQTAQRLSTVSLDSVVDRSVVIRLGYVLLAVVAVCALYRIVSPKDPFVSAGRVLMPWANLPVPSRVQILSVTPGDTSAARGEQVEISAEILGLDEDEAVRLFYSTADEQVVGQQLAMTASTGGSLFGCKLPGRLAVGNSVGVQQNLSYWIEAGDARSSRYEIEVFARPTLVVQEVHYNYPAYTGYSSQQVQNTGDLRAIEGTLVTLTAIANKPIDAAHVDFDADGRHDLLMKSEGRKATVTFPLELRDDRRTPRHRSYLLRYTTRDGRKNKLPPKYQIDVIPDYAPEIRLVEPEEAVRDVRIDEIVKFEIEARDPDFAVSEVVLFGKVSQQQVVKETLLATDRTGRFVGQIRKTPAEMGLHVGDLLDYWGAAADNRRPEPNVTLTARRKLRIVGPGERAGDQPQDRDANNDADNQDDPSQGQEGDRAQGEQQKNNPSGGSESDEGESDDEGGNQGEGSLAQPGGGPSDDQEQQRQSGGAAGESAEGEQSSESSAESTSQGGADGESDRESSESSDELQRDGGQSGDHPAGEQERVSPDGDDDGAAFERIAEHFEEQQSEQDTEADQPDDQQQADDEAGGEKPIESDSQAKGGTPDSDQSEGDADSDAAAEVGEQNDSQPGEDASEPTDEKTSNSPADGEPEDQADGEGDDLGDDQGLGEDQGLPGSEGQQKPSDKPGDQASEAGEGQQQPEAEAQDGHKSDSQGAQGGDRSGGGKEGAGQQADHDGAGGEGEHQSADNGAGQAAEPGQGESNSKPGQQQTAEGETGESSDDQPGAGSEVGESDGEQPSGEKPSADGQASSSNDNDNNSPQDADPSGGTEGNSSPPPAGDIQPGDEANLDYARKQTKLVLENLEDQLKKKKVDEGLLKKLGWTTDELRRFVDRWKNLQARADTKTAPAAAQEELDNALRSLGLTPNRRTGFRSQTTKDKLRNLQDAYRGRTPLEYQEQVRAYIKGTAAAQEE